MNRNLTVFFILAAFNVGCGALKSARPEGEVAGATQTQVQDADALGLRILRAADQDPKMPDPGSDPRSAAKPDHVIVSGDEMTFQDNVYLPDTRNPAAMFLVWPDAFKETKIQNTFVEHRLEDERNELIGEPQRFAANLDQHGKRWFLPFSAFVTNESEGADPSRQHLLTFELQLSDGSLKVVRVRLRVGGAAPTVRLEENSQISESPWGYEDFSELTSGGAQSGLVIKTGRLTNPNRRPVRIWVGLGQSDPLTLSTFLSHSTFSQIPAEAGDFHPLAPATLDPLHWFESRAQFRVTTLRIYREKAVEPESEEIGVQLRVIDLGPGQTIRLEWLARPVESQARCVLPPAEQRQFQWQNRSNRWASVLLPIEYYTQTLVQYWGFGGFRLAGNWREAIIVSNPWEVAPARVSFEDQKTSIPLGTQFSNLPAHFCQGYF